MKLIVSGPVTKRCPYKDEDDEGTVTLTFDVNEGDGPELHWVAAQIDILAKTQPRSHEDFTRELMTRLGAVLIETTWTTAGLDVICKVGL